MSHRALAQSAATSPERLSTLPLFLLPTTQLLLIPSYVALANDTSILAQPPRSIVVLVLASLAGTGLLWVVHLALGRFPGDRVRPDLVYLLLVRFFLYFIVLAGYAFPVSQLTGLTDPSIAPINNSNLVLCLVLSSILLFLWESRARKILDYLVIAYLLGNVFVVLVGAWTDAETRNGTFGAASEDHNIFVVSFDGLSRPAMLTALEEDPSLRNVLRGFTVFEKAAASSPATSASIAAELYGNQNFKLTHSTIDEVWASHPSHLLTNVLATKDFRVTAYGVYGTNLAQDEHRVEGAQLESTGYLLLTGALARTLTSTVVPDGAWAGVVRAVLLDRDRDAGLQARVARSDVPQWSRNLVLSVEDYESFVSGLHVEDARPSAFFLHFTHTHYPIQFDGNCTFRGDDPTWLATHQTHEADVELARCALSQFHSFLRRLEELDILERSMIVLKSDHGKPISYARPGSMEATAINGHPRWGVSRYAPFLAIRPYEAGSTSMEKSQSPVLLDDLARTICEESGVGSDCLQYAGYNILRNQIDPDSEVTLFIVPSQESAHDYDGHEAITLRRGEDVALSLQDAVTRRSEPPE